MTEVAVVAIVAFAAVAQTITGFGFSLLAVPPLSLLIDPKQAVAVALVLLIGNSGLLAWSERQHISWPAVRPLLLGAAPGLPIGLALLEVASADALRVALAAAVVVAVAVTTSNWLQPGPGRAMELTAGFASGALTTSITTNGPPTVLALQARRLSARAFRPTTSAVVGLCSLAGVGLFALGGRFDREIGRLVLLAAPSLVVGWAVGTRLRGAVPEEWFRRSVLTLLLAAAAAGLVSVFA